MKNPAAQLAVLILLMAAAGTVSNFARSSNPETFLRWVDAGRYPKALDVEPPSPAVSSAAAVTPAHAVKPGPVQSGSPSVTPAPSAATVPTPKPDASAQQSSDDPPGAAAQGPEGASPGTVAAPAAATGEYVLVNIDRAFEEFQAGTQFIDARRTREYEKGHIPGALSLSPWEADLPDKISKLIEDGAVTEAPVVIYCNDSKECTDSKMVNDQLKIAGFVNILIYKGGWPEWSREKPKLVVQGREPGKYTPSPQQP